MHFHWCPEETAILLSAWDQMKAIWTWVLVTAAQLKPVIARVLS